MLSDAPSAEKIAKRLDLDTCHLAQIFFGGCVNAGYIPGDDPQEVEALKAELLKELAELESLMAQRLLLVEASACDMALSTHDEPDGPMVLGAVHCLPAPKPVSWMLRWRSF